MPVLYVTVPGATVRHSDETLFVTVDENAQGLASGSRRKVLMHVASHRLELVVVVGKGHMTQEAMRHCFARGISVAWLTRGGDFVGRAMGPMPRSADIRMKQYAATLDERSALAFAKTVVQAKLRNASNVLRDVRRNSSADKTLARAELDLKQMLTQVSKCDDETTLLGVEGHGASVYFKALTKCFRGEIQFEGRRKRPAPDPANALLSFGYVLLTSRLTGLLEARGLDPHLGFFHSLRSGRPALALDLLEELRHPVVDRFVLRCCNLRILRQKHFDDPREDGGVRLNRRGAKVFFEHWEEHLMKPLKEQATEDRIAPLELLHRQVERYVSALRTGELYEPFLYGDGV